MTDASEVPALARPLYELVAHATAGTAYTVTPSATGFDLLVNHVDARWWGVLNRAGLKETYIHHVAVQPGRTFTITDDMLEVSWSAGVPTVQYTAMRSVGHFKVKRFGSAYAFDDRFRPGEVYHYRYDSEESRHLIRSAAASLGLTERLPVAAKAGLYVALGTIAALIVAALVVLLVVALR